MDVQEWSKTDSIIFLDGHKQIETNTFRDPHLNCKHSSRAPSRIIETRATWIGTCARHSGTRVDTLFGNSHLWHEISDWCRFSGQAQQGHSMLPHAPESNRMGVGRTNGVGNCDWNDWRITDAEWRYDQISSESFANGKLKRRTVSEFHFFGRNDFSYRNPAAK